MKEKTKFRLKIAFRVGGETVLYALLLFAFLCMADRFPTEGYYAETAALAGAFAVTWKYVRFLKGTSCGSGSGWGWWRWRPCRRRQLMNWPAACRFRF